MTEAERWIARLNLKPLPQEGGFFREVYRSSEQISQAALPSRFPGDRAFATSIYYLLPSHDFSALHRIKQDELWHFYHGSPITIHTIDLEGNYDHFTLGLTDREDVRFQGMVPSGWLFGATVEAPGSFCLAGCTVAPGFDFADFELPSREELLREHPGLEAVVLRLTRDAQDDGAGATR